MCGPALHAGVIVPHVGAVWAGYNVYLHRFGECRMKPVLIALLPAITLAACGGNDVAAPGDEPTAPPSIDPASTDTASTDTASRDAAPDTPAEALAILASLGGDYVDADLVNGARQFRRCQSCHTLNEGGRHTVGPNLHGVMGRAAADADRFSFSSQLSEAGLIWDLETLDAWIENPRALVPGNRMSFVGLRDAEDRRDVIAYLAVETAE